MWLMSADCSSTIVVVVMVGVVAAGCASLIGAAILLRQRKVWHDTKVCFDRIASAGFKSNEQLRTIDKSIALSICPTSPSTGQAEKPFKKGLVLIGGFGDTPHVWEGLAERASGAGWYTMAPRTPGWGRTDFAEANTASWTDWVLAVRDALAITQGICDEVTVVAHSTGAPVAAMVAELFHIDRLIFTGPNFVSNAGDMWAKRLLLKPIVGRLVTNYLGTVVKKRRMGRPIDSLNEAAFPTAFYLTCLPVRALREMWILQDQLSRPWKVSGEVLMIMGESDGSVAPLPQQAEFIRPFVPDGVPFHPLWMPDAAHGLPTETKGVVDRLARVVLGDRAALDDLMQARQNDNSTPNNSMNGLDGSLKKRKTSTGATNGQGLIANKKVL